MHNAYIRQRQGRDFPAPDNPLISAEMSLEGNYNHIDGVINGTKKEDGETEKKSILERLEAYRAEAEQNSLPVDGKEPDKVR